MSEDRKTTRVVLTPEEQHDADRINEHIDASNEALYKYIHTLEQAAKRYQDRPEVRSFFGEGTISVVCEILYKWIPAHFSLSLSNVEARVRQEYTSVRETEQSDLHTMPYGDYLLTEHWQQVRRAALERALYRCQICNSPNYLNVHHRTYERRGYERDDDLLVLCRNCHQIFHENGKLAVEFRGE